MSTLRLLQKRKLLISALLCVIANSRTFSQAAIDISHNSMRIGDVVKKYRMSTEDIWDLSESERCSEALSEAYEDFKTDTITSLFRGMRKYYAFHSDSLLQVGSESPQIMECFYIPETSYVFPMSLGDKHGGSFASHVSYCDKMVFHKYGSCTIHADSVGTLILPDGSIVSGVLQISRERRFVYEQAGLGTSMDSLLLDEAEILRRHAEADSIYTEVEKELYAWGYRYPIDYTLKTQEIGLAYEMEVYLDKNSEIWNMRKLSATAPEIVLFSCSTGISGKFAQTLSADDAFKDIKIYAPNKDISIDKNGKYFIDAGGQWCEYVNGELTKTYSGAFVPGTKEFSEASYWEREVDNDWTKKKE